MFSDSRKAGVGQAGLLSFLQAKLWSVVAGLSTVSFAQKARACFVVSGKSAHVA